jgi:leader peptidase (prepilin peptidase)/N-methyltransferase
LLLVVGCVLGIVVAFVQMARPSKQDAGAAGADAAPDASDEANASAAPDASGEANASAPAPAPSSSLSVTIPWGPSIAVACWFTMLAGGPIVSWYLSLF